MAKRSAQSKKSGKSAGLRYLEPRTHNQYDTQRRVLDALSEKRRNPKLSLSAAAKHMGTTVKTIRSYAGPALEMRSGRIDVKAVDRIARTLQILTPSGLETVTVRNSRDATRISRHHHAARHALLTFGTDTRALEGFAGKTLRAGGKTYTFVTDYATLVRIARAGEVYFLDIYGPESRV
jgi:ribosomal protein L32E